MSIPVATRSRILSLLFLCFSFARSQTCYISAGVAAASSIVPCGTGDVACCQLGDICLEDSACYNVQFEVTYLYGCTDSSYSDAVCPWKCGPDFAGAPYVGLDYCSNITSNLWSCTHPPDDSSTVQTNPPQECLDDSQVAFAAGPTINPILSLPSTVGGATEYYSEINPTSFTLVPGYTPDSLPVVVPSKPTSPEQVIPAVTTTTTTTTTTTSSTTRSSSPSPTSTRTTTSSPTTSSSTLSTTTSFLSSSSAFVQSTTVVTSSTTTSSSASTSTAAAAGSSLSTSAKAGIGAGVGGAALAAAVIAALLLFLRRKRQTHQHEPVPQHEVPYSPTGFVKQQPYIDHQPGVAPVVGAASASAGRSELPAEIPQRYTNIRPISEVESYSRYGSPSPTYSSWDNSGTLNSTSAQGRASPRPGHDVIHELG